MFNAVCNIGLGMFYFHCSNMKRKFVQSYCKYILKECFLLGLATFGSYNVPNFITIIEFSTLLLPHCIITYIYTWSQQFLMWAQCHNLMDTHTKQCAIVKFNKGTSSLYSYKMHKNMFKLETMRCVTTWTLYCCSTYIFVGVLEME